MNKYYINNIDLATFGITVEKFSGFESFPKRKGTTEYNWLNQNGIEAFTGPTETFYESRDLTLSLTFRGSDETDIQSKLASFFDFVKIGELVIKVDNSPKTYTCFFKDGAEAKRESKMFGEQCYSLELKVTEINPVDGEPTPTPYPFAPDVTFTDLGDLDGGTSTPTFTGSLDFTNLENI